MSTATSSPCSLVQFASRASALMSRESTYSPSTTTPEQWRKNVGRFSISSRMDVMSRSARKCPAFGVGGDGGSSLTAPPSSVFTRNVRTAPAAMRAGESAPTTRFVTVRGAKPSAMRSSHGIGSSSTATTLPACAWIPNGRSSHVLFSTQTV